MANFAEKEGTTMPIATQQGVDAALRAWNERVQANQCTEKLNVVVGSCGEHKAYYCTSCDQCISVRSATDEAPAIPLCVECQDLNAHCALPQQTVAAA